MKSWNFSGHPVEEVEFVRRLIINIRRIRQEQNIKKDVEIQLKSIGNNPMTDAGGQLLKKLVNAVVVGEATMEEGANYPIITIQN